MKVQGYTLWIQSYALCPGRKTENYKRFVVCILNFVYLSNILLLIVSDSLHVRYSGCEGSDKYFLMMMMISLLPLILIFANM